LVWVDLVCIREKNRQAKVRIAGFWQSGYKLIEMLTSLLIAVSIWGTDPEIVFSGESAPWTQSESSQDSTSVATDGTQYDSVIRSRSILRPDIVRGQNVIGDYPPPYTNPSGYNNQIPPNSLPPYDGDGLAPYNRTTCATFFESPFVKEFFEGMNPFVPAVIHSLPNYYDPFGSQMGTGSFGPPGYRLGWVSYNDITVLPLSSARGTAGSMQITEWNSNAKYSHLVAPGVLFNGTGFFNARWWQGPSGTALPAQVDQISTDLELGLFNDGPWSGQIAFHPQIVETYEAKLDRNAFNFDGRAIATFKASQQWSFVGGVAIWDRVTTMVVPHAGVIWTPNERWEFRILYPKSRISYFLGNRWNADFWVYGQAEYTAEAWQSVDPQSPNIDRMQITDDRLSLGLRWDSGRYSVFTEGGYVFNRQIKFEGSAPGFDLDNTWMFRAGFRY